MRTTGQPDKVQASASAGLPADVAEAYCRLVTANEKRRRRGLARLASRNPALARRVRAMLEAENSPQACGLDRPLLDLDALLASDGGEGGDGRTSATRSHDAAGSPHASSAPANAPVLHHAPDLGERYEVLSLIGVGSHGRVYHARQRWPIEREVAVKVLGDHEGVGARAADRLEREAQILGSLGHRGIAAIYDAGRTAGGQPFLVTELVEGLPIDGWCERHGVGFALRCRLLACVCRAVEHAHQRGVIHRDLKPANILVGGGPDGDPRPTIVDFGIARLLDSSGGAGTLTAQGALLGTAGFIAPEQLTGEPADTRSDVFALGRVLARLVQPPDRADDHRRGAVVAPGSLAARDAAAIIRRATAADRRDRYQSAGALADDLEAMLASRPVSARRPPVRERVMRVARRHPSATVMVVMLAGTLAVGGMLLAAKTARASQAVELQKELITGTLRDVVGVMERYGETVEQRQALAERLEHQLEGLLAFSPKDAELRVLLATVRVELASIATARGDTAAAADLANTAIASLARDVDPATAPIADTRALAKALAVRSGVYDASGDRRQSRRHDERAMRVLETLALRYPNHVGVLDDLCWVYERLSSVSLSEHQCEGLDRAALERVGRQIDRRLKIATRMLELDPTRTLSRYNLASAQQQRARFVGLERPQEAMALLSPAIATLEALVAAEPTRLGFVFTLCHTYGIASHLHSQLGDKRGALRILERSLGVLEDLERLAGFQHAHAGKLVKPLRYRINALRDELRLPAEP